MTAQVKSSGSVGFMRIRRLERDPASRREARKVYSPAIALHKSAREIETLLSISREWFLSDRDAINISCLAATLSALLFPEELAVWRGN